MKKEKLVPELRFPEFEGDWRQNRLGDISEFISKGTTPKNFTEKGVNYVKIESLNGKDIIKERCLYIDENTHLGELKRSILKEGDILFAIAGATVGKIGIVTKNILPANTNQALAIIRLKNKEQIDFVLYILDSVTMKKYIDQSISVGAQPNLNLQQINNFKYLSSSLPEQQKIATFLTSVDKRIQLLTKKKEKLQEYKKGVMQKIFLQEIRFKDGDGKDFPDWEEKKLGELTYKTGKKNKEKIKYPIYSINNVDGFLPQSEQFDGIDSNARGFDISLYKIVDKHTFAYNPARINVGSIGFSGELEKVIISSLYVCFKTKEKLDDKYLLQYTKTCSFNKDVLRNVEGGVRDYLFYENFSRINIPLPSVEEQQKIATFLTSLDKQIEQVEKQVEKMREWKKGLLQKMFV